MRNALFSWWLTLMCFAIVFMVFIGGLTRLTNSGLSMTEWRPVTGWIPPLNATDWDTQFQKYQASPEYNKINKGMSLKEFKSIYWLEFFHRIAGRLTALLYIIPLIIFTIRDDINSDNVLIYGGIGVLLLLQGVMGWYMVKSGLVDDPHVSHFRLAAHLMLAIIIYSLIFWQKMVASFDIAISPESKNLRKHSLFLFLTLILLYSQIFVGALVAGLDAGMVYNSYPLMGEHFVPTEIYALKLGIHIFSDPVFVQFTHRMLAIFVLIFVCISAAQFLLSGIHQLKKAGIYMLVAVGLQFTLGIATLIYHVPLYYALAHQICAIFLLSTILWGIFLIKK